MAERFFFDLTDGVHIIPDETGVLAADLNEAITQAVAVLQEISAAEDLRDVDEAWALIIRDAGGKALITLPVVPPPSGTAPTP